MIPIPIKVRLLSHLRLVEICGTCFSHTHTYESTVKNADQSSELYKGDELQAGGCRRVYGAENEVEKEKYATDLHVCVVRVLFVAETSS